MRASHFLAALIPAGVLATDYTGFSRWGYAGAMEVIQGRDVLGAREMPAGQLLAKRDVCSSNGYATCGDSCMPIGANCCGSDGSFCRAGNRCDDDGCCPIGKTCTGPGGTMTYNIDLTSTGAVSRPTSASGSGGSSSGSSSSCDTGEVACGNVCIPTSYTCCPDKLGGCSSSETCQLSSVNNQYGCCPKGETCSGAGGSTGGGSGSSGSGSSGSGSSGSGSSVSSRVSSFSSRVASGTVASATAVAGAGGVTITAPANSGSQTSATAPARAGGNVLAVGAGPAFAAGAVAAGMALL